MSQVRPAAFPVLGIPLWRARPAGQSRVRFGESQGWGGLFQLRRGGVGGGDLAGRRCKRVKNLRHGGLGAGTLALRASAVSEQWLEWRIGWGEGRMGRWTMRSWGR